MSVLDGVKKKRIEEIDSAQSICIYVYHMLDHYSNGPHSNFCQGGQYMIPRAVKISLNMLLN